MANLLDEASILLTPTAYNNGSMLAVKPENGDGDMTFSRNSAATRVNAQGLVENVQILSSNLVSNGDFSQEGSELVTNGYFATDTNWNKSTGWSISGGTANSNDTNSFIFQNLSGTTTNDVFKVTYTISNYVSGNVAVGFGSGLNQPLGTQRNSNGTYTEYLTKISTSTAFGLKGFSFTGSIDNISVKEVGQDWTLGTGWSVGEDKATVDNTINASLDQFIPFLSGKKVKVSFEISDLQVGGNIIVGDIVTPGAYTATSNGIQTFNYSATNSTLRVRGKGYPCSITNISVIEITDDTNLPRINYEGFSYQDALGSEEIVNGDFATDTNWDLGNGWTISGGSANSDGINFPYIKQNFALISGKTYKLTFDITSYTSGSIKYEDSVETSIFYSGLGSYSQIFTASSNNCRFQSAAFNGSITNVSVKEYLGQEVVPNSGCGSWLLEPQSTNLVPYSENFSQWSIQRSNILSNQIIAPNGTLTAYKFYEQIDVNTNRYIYIRPTVTAGINYTQSIFAKKGERSWIFLESDGKGAYFDLENGVLGTVHSDITANIISMGNGWYKCSISKLSVATVPYLAYYIALSNNTKVYDGDGTSGVYIWGGQLEQNSYATSYIPTQGASSTRLQDIATNSGNASLINSEEGTLYAEISALANGGVSRVISINDGTYSMNNSILFSYSQGTNRLDVNGRVGGVYQFIFNRTITDTTINHKIAVVWKVNRFELWVDGVMTDQDLLGSVNSANTFTKLQLSNGNTSNPFYGKNKALAVYKTALTDAELTLLTTI